MNYFRACKEYKKLNKRNKRTKSAFFQNIYSQLDEINETNPKLFWKTIDKIKKNVEEHHNKTQSKKINGKMI